MKYKKLFDYLEKKSNFRKVKTEDTWTCYNDLRFTKQFCKENKLNFEELKKKLEDTGGFCDCEVLFNSAEKIKEDEEIK